MLELGDRATDEDALILSYIDGFKKDVLTQILLKRPYLFYKAEQFSERADATLFR